MENTGESKLNPRVQSLPYDLARLLPGIPIALIRQPTQGPGKEALCHPEGVPADHSLDAESEKVGAVAAHRKSDHFLASGSHADSSHCAPVFPVQTGSGLCRSHFLYFQWLVQSLATIYLGVHRL